MKKSSSPSFVVHRRIYTDKCLSDFLDKKINICHKIYNSAVKHYKKVLFELKNDVWFQYNLQMYLEYKNNPKLQKEYSIEISACISAYKLNEYDIHEYMGIQKQKSFLNGIGINIVQKLGTELYQAIKKVLFSTGNQIHFRKKGQTCSFEDKRANSGIIYNLKTDSVKVMGKVIPLKPIRTNDIYLQEAMTHKIKYCRMIRMPFKSGYKYFLQLVMEGTPPKKLIPGTGKIGLDPGVSTVSFYGDKITGFEVLANGIESYDKKIKTASIKYERRRRFNNPDNYKPDGTVRPDTDTFHKTWKHTKGMFQALMELKDAYRKKSAYIKQAHGKLSNLIVSSYNEIIKEPMDYNVLARKAKETSRQMKKSSIKTATGIKNIHKYKRRKRFGCSIGRRSPGLFIRILTDKMNRYGGCVMDVNIHKYRASQYDHIIRKAVKIPLSCRVKEIGGYKVQRDLYSAFLLHNAADAETIDFDSCDKGFPDFLKKQEIVINTVKIRGDITNNFGLV